MENTNKVVSIHQSKISSTWDSSDFKESTNVWSAIQNKGDYSEIERKENLKEQNNKKAILKIKEEIKHYNTKLISCLEFYKDITWEDFDKSVTSHINQTKYDCSNCLDHISEKQQLTEKYTNRINSLNDKIESLEEEVWTLQTEVYIDELTQINNRKRFFQYYNAAIKDVEKNSRKTFSLAIIDVDNFKHFNDTYGHPAWDIVLKLITAIISKEIKSISNSTALCRIWWEEFAIISRKPLKDILQIVEKVLNILSTNIISIPGIPKDYRLSFSAGIASYTPDMQWRNMALIETADKRLYKAKEKWKAQVCSSD